MAYVPELDDDASKPASTDDKTNDISAQAAPTPSTATGGQSASGSQANQGPSSSGSFQDFSKFKTANQSKLSALSNLATDQAKSGVDSAKSAFDNVGSAYQGQIKQNAKNFDTSAYKDLNNNSDIDTTALSKDLNEAQTPYDSGTLQGQLAGTQEYTDLHNKVNQVGTLGTRAGTASVLGDYNNANGNQASSAAANQDAMLLQSMGDYRNSANQLAQSTKGVDANELSAQQAALANQAKVVNDNNATYRTKAIEALQGLQGNLQNDLTNRATQATADHNSQVSAQVAAAKAQIEAQARATLGQTTNHDVSQYNGTTYSQNGVGLTAAERAQNATKADLARTGSLEDLAKAAGYDPNTYDSVLNGYTSQNNAPITADNIYAQDMQRQKQITALNALLGGGKNYNASAMMPVSTQLDTSSATQKLIAALQGKIAATDSRTDGGLNAPAVVTGANSVKPLTPAPVTKTRNNLG